MRSGAICWATNEHRFEHWVTLGKWERTTAERGAVLRGKVVTEKAGFEGKASDGGGWCKYLDSLTFHRRGYYGLAERAAMVQKGGTEGLMIREDTCFAFYASCFSSRRRVLWCQHHHQQQHEEKSLEACLMLLPNLLASLHQSNCPCLYVHQPTSSPLLLFLSISPLWKTLKDG